MSKIMSRRQLKGIQKGQQAQARRRELQAQRDTPCPTTPLVATMATNLDQLVIVSALTSPPLRWGLIDRLLVLAEQEGLDPLIVLTKLDLAEDRGPARSGGAEPSVWSVLALYQGLGYPVLATSSQRGEGIEELARALRGRRSALSGHSGVGKSSLLQALCPELSAEERDLDIPVGSVSEIGKGCHTTTRTRCWKLACGALVWDLPGLRQVGLKADEVADCFPDFRAPSRRCRFNDCSHRAEPGCGVLAAVEQGTVAATRYRSYLSILAG